MTLVELCFIALGLSMDAFAAALCQGLCMKKPDIRRALIIAFFFGGFQAIMPLVGWFFGIQFKSFITAIDHWFAFCVLGFIGGKMIFDALKLHDTGKTACICTADSLSSSLYLNIKELIVLGLATSIDALTVGISIAFFKTLIIPAILLIGITTFVLSFAGIFIGRRFGAKIKNKAEFFGGLVLVFIGIKILIEHLIFI